MTAVHSDDLEVLERLGGSGATVHRAVVRTTGRVVVVKRAPWDRPDVADRLGREAAVLGRVHHPSLVRLLDLVEDEVGRTLVLAHAPGGSLAGRLQRLGPMAPADVADLGERVARALVALHGEGVVHRDVHPGNVLVDAELQPVLADLDNALDSRGAQLPGDRDVVGGPGHVDPRLFTGATADPASDLHALATTLWTAATGAPPPRSGPEAPVRLGVDDRVPGPLREVLLACLGDSVGDAATVASHLAAAAAELLHLPELPQDPPPTPAATQVQPWAPPTASPPAPPLPTEPSAHAAPAPPAATTSLAPSPSRPPRLVAGGAGGTGDPVTRRWGPAPHPRPVAAAVARHTGRLAVAALVVLVPLVLVGWLALRASTSPTTQGDADLVEPPAPCSAADVTAETPPATASDPVASALADLDGDGCSEVVRLVDGVLHAPAGRYRVGEPGDVLLTGDWDGDGRWGVGLYRPATGTVFLFDETPGPGARSRPARQLPAGGTPVVVDRDGAHLVVVQSEPQDPRCTASAALSPCRG